MQQIFSIRNSAGLAILLFILTGCPSSPPNPEKVPTVSLVLRERPVYEIPFELTDYMGILALWGDRFISYRMGDDGLVYFSSKVENGKTEEIGRETDFAVSNDSSALIGDHLYTYVTSGAPNGFCVNLFEMDVRHSRLRKLTSENVYQTLTYTKDLGNELVTLKGERQNDDARSYIEAFDSSSHKVRTVVEFPYDFAKESGTIIKNISVYQDKLYALAGIVEEGHADYALIVYNGEGTAQHKYDMNAFRAILDGGGVGKLKVMGDYVFVSNFSNRSALGKLSGDEVKVVVSSEDGFELAQDSVSTQAGHYYLFKRDSNRFYRLDPSRGELDEIPSPFSEKKEVLTYMITDSQGHAILIMGSEAGKRTLLYVNLEDYLNSVKGTPHTLSTENPLVIDSK